MLRKTTLGVIAGVLFMGVEGVGSLYLIRSLLHVQGSGQASQFTLITYLWLAFNVVANSLGFVASRAAARLHDRRGLRLLVRNVSRVGKLVLIPATVCVVLAMTTLFAASRISAATAIASILFIAGHAFRVLGLLKIYVSVGDGHLGSDKWYQLSMSLGFYAFAVIAAQHGIALMWIGAIYACVGTFVFAGSARWLAAILPSAPTTTEAVGIITPRALALQTLAMVGYTAAGFLAGNADAFIARTLLADTSFVQYAVTAKLGQVIALTAALVPAMYGPRITRAHLAVDVDALARYRRESLSVAVGLSACGALLMFALRDTIGRWLIPGGHEVFSSVLWIMAAGAILQAAALSMANAINSVGGLGLVRLTLLSAGAAICTSIPLGHYFGPVGVATGTVCGSVVMIIGLLRITSRVFLPRVPPNP